MSAIGWDSCVRRQQTLMLRQRAEREIMTIQNLESVGSKRGETMQNLNSDNVTNEQPLTSKNGHISFSVASLLADTRHSKSSSPVSQSSSTLAPSSPNPSLDEEFESNQGDDSIVDVEDLNQDQKCASLKEEDAAPDAEAPRREAILNPIRPTPFSAMAAVLAAQQNWSHQNMMNHFGGPPPVFQGSGPFGLGGMNSGKISLIDIAIKSLDDLVKNYIILTKYYTLASNNHWVFLSMITVPKMSLLSTTYIKGQRCPQHMSVKSG